MGRLKYYAVAVSGIALSLLFGLHLSPGLGGHSPYLFFIPAVMLTSLAGGLLPGLFATLLSALVAVYFFVEPSGSLDISDPVHLTEVIVFVLSGIASAFACEFLQRARSRASEAEAKLRIEEEKRAAEQALLQAEAALLESEERFQVAQELSPDGFIILRPARNAEGGIVDFTWIYANAAAERIVGMKLSALKGKSLLETFPGHRSSVFFERYRQTAETGMASVCEAPYHGDEIIENHWFRVVVVSMGKDIAVLSQDVTARKRVEEALEAQRDLLETVVNHIPASVNLIGGTDLRIKLVNSAYQAIAPGKDMVGKTLDELWPETGRNFSALCRRVLETGEPHHVEDEFYEICRQPGGPLERAYFSWSLHRVRLPGDEGWGILNTAWETTGRKETEEALRESEERFRIAQEISPDGFLILRPVRDDLGTVIDFVWIYQNEAA